MYSEPTPLPHPIAGSNEVHNLRKLKSGLSSIQVAAMDIRYGNWSQSAPQPVQTPVNDMLM